MKVFREGMRDGIPIGLGYFAVSFSLGIAAKNAGLSAFQGFVASILNIASAGEYALFSMISIGATYLETAVMILVVNARYLLMSCALSQRFSEKTGFFGRLTVGAFITDELFGIAIARKGPIDPNYTYGAALTSVLPWGIGTSLGIILGNILPFSVVSALSVAIFGMFLAIIIPPARENRVILVFILFSFLFSYLSETLTVFRRVSPGLRTILLTVILSALAAAFFPVKEDEDA